MAAFVLELPDRVAAGDKETLTWLVLADEHGKSLTSRP